MTLEGSKREDLPVLFDLRIETETHATVRQLMLVRLDAHDIGAEVKSLDVIVAVGVGGDLKVAVAVGDLTQRSGRMTEHGNGCAPDAVIALVGDLAEQTGVCLGRRVRRELQCDILLGRLARLHDHQNGLRLVFETVECDDVLARGYSGKLVIARVS